MDIEAIEREEGVEFSINPKNGHLKTRGTAKACDRARSRLNEDYSAAMRQIRDRQGEPAEPIVEIEEDDEWSREAEVKKQMTFQASKGTYHQWGIEELENLRRFLQPGDRVIPTYAYSCFIQRGTEQIHFRKDGKVIE